MAYSIGEAKNLVIEAGLKLQKEGLIVRTWGNISARVDDKQFVITPSGRSYDSLKPDDIVLVNIKKCTYEGDVKPSSEVGIHADVFAMRPEVNFVVHTHQTYASAVSVLGEDIELSDEEKVFLGEKIPCAEYGMSSSEPLRKKVKKCLKKSVGCSSMLLRNHGVLCMGKDFENAFEISSMMEQVCKFRYEQLTAREVSDNVESDYQSFIDYGTSHINDDMISLTVDGKEYTFGRGAKNPAGRGIGKRNINKVADIHNSIYENTDAKCIFHVTLPNVVDVSLISKGFGAYIDDQAQIVGTSVKCIGKASKKPSVPSASSVVRGLKKNNAVLIAGQGAICTGDSESDLEAIAFVLEKGCMAAKLAMLKDACSVPKRIAKKEREFYREVYSKRNNVAVETEGDNNEEKDTV